VLFKALLADISAKLSLSQVAGVAEVMLLGFMVAGVGVNKAPVHPVVVPASVSAWVAISTLPATVVLALTTDPVALVLRAPAI